MSSPLLNFVAAVGIGLVVGVVGGFALRGRIAGPIWQAPVFATAGSLIASVLAVLFGNDKDYGWKEAILQVVLALGGVAAAYLLGSRSAARASGATARTHE